MGATSTSEVAIETVEHTPAERHELTEDELATVSGGRHRHHDHHRHHHHHHRHHHHHGHHHHGHHHRHYHQDDWYRW